MLLGMVSGPRGTWFERSRQRWVDRAAQRMFGRLAANPASYRSAPSTVAATALAILILAAVAGALALLVWVTLHASGPEWVVVVLGWLAVIVVRPRIPRLPREAVVLDDADYPGLHSLIRQMASAVGVLPPRIVAVDLDFNAYVMPVGIRGRPAMVLGLPSMTLLSWHARLGVIGHELGHLRGLDTGRGRIIGAARGSLAGLHHLLAPSDDNLNMADHSEHPGLDPGGGFAVVVTQCIQTVVAAPFLLLMVLLDRLSLSARQHQEYLADRRAAEVVGSEGVAENLYLDVDAVAAAAAGATRRGEDPFEHLGSKAALTSTRRAARLRELAAAPRRADATHPPNDLRIRLLLADPRPPSPAGPTEIDCARAEQELVLLRAAMSKRFGDDLMFGRYS
jgi:heat shock protein HtpX